jgi:hypothetical protein
MARRPKTWRDLPVIHDDKAVALAVLKSQGLVEREREVAAGALARIRHAADALRALRSEAEPITNALAFLDHTAGYFEYSMLAHWGEPMPARVTASGKPDRRGRRTTTLAVQQHLAAWLVGRGFASKRKAPWKFLRMNADSWAKRPAVCDPKWSDIFDAMTRDPLLHIIGT